MRNLMARAKLRSLAEHARHVEARPGSEWTGWFESEHRVCQEMQALIKVLEKVKKDECEAAKEYLKRADDSGQHPMGRLLRFGMVILILFEATLLGLVFAKYLTGTNAAFGEVYLTAILIGLVGALALAILTHFAGKGCYYLKKWGKVVRAHKRGASKTSDGNLSLQELMMIIETEDPGIEMSSEERKKDEERNRNYLWIAARMKDIEPKNQWSVVLAALVLVVGIMVAGYLVRYVDITAEQHSGGNEVATSSSNPYDTVALPGDDPQPSEEDRGGIGSGYDKTQELFDKNFATRISLAVLAAIFLVIQLVSIALGYAGALAGRRSKDAYKKISEYEQQENEYIKQNQRNEEIEKMAQRRVSKLRRKFEAINRKDKSNEEIAKVLGHRVTPSFKAFKENEEKEQDREKERGSRPQAGEGDGRPAPLVAVRQGGGEEG